MLHEDKMRNDPVYKILQHLMDKRSKLPQICEKEGDFAVDQFINELDWLINDEAPEIYRLFQYDNRLLEAPDCSPAGEPNPSESPYDELKYGVEDSSYECPACGTTSSHMSGTGVCEKCEEKGIWIDPAGGIHTDDEDDPAAMYE